MAVLISIGQVVDQSIHHYKKYFADALGISLWLFAGLPLLILSFVVRPDDTTVVSAPYIASAILGLLGAALTGAASIWTLTSLTLAVEAHDEGKRATAKSVGKKAWGLFPKVLGFSIGAVALAFAALLPIVPGATLTIMPAIVDMPVFLSGMGVFLFFAGGCLAAILLAWLLITLVFGPYALVLEGRGIFGAVNRARVLVEGRWWAVMFRVLIPKLIIFVIVYFIEYVFVQLMAIFLASLIGMSDRTAALLWMTFKNISVTGLTALIIPMLVIADYYVYRSLVDTRGKAAV